MSDHVFSILTEIIRVMEVPDGIPKWSGHKGESELLQELTDDKGYVEAGNLIYVWLTVVNPEPCRNTRAKTACPSKRCTVTRKPRRQDYNASFTKLRSGVLCIIMQSHHTSYTAARRTILTCMQ